MSLTIVAHSGSSLVQDFATWKAIHLPGVRDLDLRSVWRDMPVRFVAYMLAQPPPATGPDGQPVPSSTSTSIPHTTENKKYFFSIELAHHGPDAVTRLVRD